MSTVGRTLGWAWQVAAWSFVIGVTGVLAVALVVPRIAGATPYSVVSSSMEPDLPSGSLVVVRPVDPAAIGLGSVITYQLESGEAAVVTHRVVAVETAIDGELRFVTQGDANDAPDTDRVRPVQIRGERWYAVPRLGHLNALLTGSERQLVAVVVASLLLGYSAFTVICWIRARSRRDVPSLTDRSGAAPDHDGRPEQELVG